MPVKDQESSIKEEPSFELARWYYVLIFVLTVLSLVTLNRNEAGAWEITVGIRETTPILVALFILPFILKLLIGSTKKGALEVSGLGKISWENILEIDSELAEKKSKLKAAGEAAKEQKNSSDDFEQIRVAADIDLERTVDLQELPLIQHIYLQRLDELVKSFNRNRHLRSSNRSTFAEADDIAYKMRAIAPLLFNQLDISGWLNSPSLGKQLAAIKYLDWNQDIEFAEDLASRLQVLETNGDTFQAYHILLALLSMANQLSYDYKNRIKELLKQYKPQSSGDSSREYIKERILKILS